MARAGPECSLATVPTRIYTPAPIVAPTPTQEKINFHGELQIQKKGGICLRSAYEQLNCQKNNIH